MPNININIVVQPMLLPILKKNLWWAGNARAQNKPHFRMSKIRFQYRGYDIRSVNYASTTSASTKSYVQELCYCPAESILRHRMCYN